MEGKGRKGEKGKIDGRCRAKFGWSGFLGVTHLLHPLRLFFCTHLLYVPSFCFRCMRLNFPGFVRRGHCRRGIETLRTLPNCKITDDLT